jgi:hypothetical protein
MISFVIQIIFCAIYLSLSSDKQTRADNRNIGADISTVPIQTYQNYRSALKWWHENSCGDFDKVG